VVLEAAEQARYAAELAAPPQQPQRQQQQLEVCGGFGQSLKPSFFLFFSFLLFFPPLSALLT
jgi:hypothetical protein